MSKRRWLGIGHLSLGIIVLLFALYYLVHSLPFLRHGFSPELYFYINKGYVCAWVLLISATVNISQGTKALKKSQTNQIKVKNSLLTLGATALIDLIMLIFIYINIVKIFQLGWFF